MLRYILAIGPLLIATSAFSDEKDASYYCMAQHAVGMAFDAQTKQWNNTSFTLEKAFVLHLHYIGEDEQTWTHMQRYSLTITPQGSNKGQGCVGRDRDVGLGEVNVYTKEDIECWTSFGIYNFNLVNNRFIQFYPYGFIEGRDDGKDTPSITAGACTHIQ